MLDTISVYLEFGKLALVLFLRFDEFCEVERASVGRCQSDDKMTEFKSEREGHRLQEPNAKSKGVQRPNAKASGVQKRA